jgi:hypothetical protein
MLKLKRSYLDNCTIGKLYFQGEFICYTVERPWLNNEKNVSCVPSGLYQLQPYSSSKYNDCYSLTAFNLGVGLTPKFHRTHILIHPGNFPNDIQGCIAPGLYLHPTVWGVSQSRVAMDKLRGIIESNKIEEIEIT